VVNLTDKQMAFCQEYIIDLNATQAAIRAGYSNRRAKEMGYQLLHKTTLSEEIHRLMDERSKRVELDADAVMKHLKNSLEHACKEVETENGTILANHAAYNKAIELAMRHNGMLIDRKEITGKDGGAIELSDTERVARITAILSSVDKE